MSATDAWTIVGALAAVVAAVFAALAWRQGGQTAKRVDERYERDAEPIPRVVEIDLNRAVAHVSNAGGAARHVVVLMEYRVGQGTIFVAGGAVPGHCAAVNLPMAVFARDPAHANVAPSPVRIAAKDMLGRWWDCNVGRPIADWPTWWAQATAALGMPDLLAVESDDGQTIGFQLAGERSP